MQGLILRLILAAALALSLSGPAAAQQAAQRGILPPPGTEIEYTTQPRDTMIGIARRYLIEGQLHEVQRALWEYNRLKDKDQIAPGQIIRIPENWLKEDANSIQLTHVEGDVQSKGQPLRQGAKLEPGDDIKTGRDGYVTIKLADGSTLVLQPGSDMGIEGVKKSPLAPAANALFSLKNGRIEASVPKRSVTGARFEVRTPIAVAAVRGTRFRVLSSAEIGRLTTEVIEGEVQVNDVRNLGSVAVAEGFGTRVIDGSAPDTPRTLLPAPRLWTGIRLWLRKPVRLNFTRLAGAVNYRVLVARQADFRGVIVESVLPTNEIVLPDLENGPYFLRVRGIDDIGLEGKDSAADLVLALDTTAPAPAPPPAASPGAPAATPVPAQPSAPPASPPARSP